MGMPGIGEGPGIGGIEVIGPLFIGIFGSSIIFFMFGSSIIFFMSPSMDLQQSCWAERPAPGCQKRRKAPAAMTKMPTAMPVSASVRYSQLIDTECVPAGAESSMNFSRKNRKSDLLTY